MDIFEWLVTNLYLPRKAKISQDAAINSPKLALPVLGQAGPDQRLSMETLNNINGHIARHPYVSDPLSGWADFYNHPGYSQHLLISGDRSQSYDCDDFACFAVALAWAAGMSRDKAWVWNIVVRPWNILDQGAKNHVIAGFEFWDGTKIWTCVMDTNTAARGQLFWFPGNRDQVRQAVINHFSSIYQAPYQYLIQVPFPFQI